MSVEIVTDSSGKTHEFIHDDLSSSSQEGGVLTASQYGLISSTTLDQTSMLQAFINEVTTAKLKIIDVARIKHTSPLTFPAAGTKIMGGGSGGDFTQYILAEDCPAMQFSDVHHIELSNLMWWPQGTTPPQYFILIEGSYSIRLQNIRIHQSNPGAYLPSVAAIKFQKTGGGQRSQDIILDHMVLRVDGTGQHTVGFDFGADFGEATLIGCDTEKCATAFKHSGGKVKMIGPYTEQIGVNVVSLEPSTDASASFTVVGGNLGASASCIPIAVRSGAKNTRINGTYISELNTYQAFIYGLTGSSNVVLDIANPINGKLGSNVTPTPPGIVQWGRGLNNLPATKFSSINVTTGTLAAGAITGAGSTVTLMSTNAAPGNQQTRTAAEMIVDQGLGEIDHSYLLRIINTGAGTFTLTAGAGVTLTGTMTVPTNTYRDFVVAFNGNALTVTIQSVGVGTYS